MANTTSGTVTFDKTFAIDEIIEEAYERIGMQGTSGYQLKTARRSLNILSLDKTTVTFYPTPNSTAASNYAHIYFVKRIQDAGDYTNATDVPYRFVPCMSSGLAFYLSQKYNPEMTQNLKLLYEDELARALSEDGSPSSSYITPKTYFPSI
jgi:hypothetical protein